MLTLNLFAKYTAAAYFAFAAVTVFFVTFLRFYSTASFLSWNSRHLLMSSPTVPTTSACKPLSFCPSASMPACQHFYMSVCLHPSMFARLHVCTLSCQSAFLLVYRSSLFASFRQFSGIYTTPFPLFIWFGGYGSIFSAYSSIPCCTYLERFYVIDLLVFLVWFFWWQRDMRVKALG